VTSKTEDPANAHRDAVGLLAVATASELAVGMAVCGDTDAIVDLKPPETGLVMLRGRIGGDGAPFNVGEATVTRAVVRLANGTVGYSYRLGRDKAAARQAAILDALWQTPDRREQIEARVLKAVRDRIAADRDRAGREAAASKVEFFTLARENP
jgi:alpha-D-ribose 1-methylphosphonate 5-triphosphate synthase subunit PhnG